MNNELLKKTMPELNNYFGSQKDIATVYLFGSYGTELYDPERSDLDLAILFYRSLSLKEEMLIDAEISMILGRDNIDITNLNKTRVDICHQVLLTGEIIYEENKIVTANFMEKTLKLYFDYGIPLYKMKVDFVDGLKGGSGTGD